MRSKIKQTISVILCLSMILGMTGCGKKVKKEPKPKPKVTISTKKGSAQAGGKGDGQADSPIVIGCDKLNKNFNPFSAKSAGDKEVVRLTQAYLVTNDRAGKPVYKGVEGEVRLYNDNGYTYYGPADISVQYRKKKNRTVYTIKLDDDLLFSDGENVTADDVIFSLYAFCDKSYKGDEKIGKQKITGLQKYRKNKKVRKISGIRKTGKYSLTLTTDGYSDDTIKALQIPICPLHYYGDESKYNYKKGRFGFKKGDISSVRANKRSPMGAGPYRYVKYEKKIVYYTYNELYFNGCPKTAFVQIKEMSGILKKANKRVAKVIAEEKKAEAAGEDEKTQDNNEDTKAGDDKAKDENASDEETVNHVAEVTEVTEGTVDVLDRNISGDDLEWIAKANSNGKLYGSDINTSFTSDKKFSYVGINAKNVRVANKSESEQSKALRKAIASAISAQRIQRAEELAGKVKILNYPYTSESWLSPNTGDEDYNRAYSDTIDGEEIYNDDMTDEDKRIAVKDAATKYLEKAGYTFKDGVLESIPVGASKTYRIYVENGRKNMLYPMIKEASALLKDIGFNLKIVSVTKKQMNSKKFINKAQLWCDETDTSYGYSLYKKYMSKTNMFGIKIPEFSTYLKKTDATVKMGRKQKLYKKVFNNILEQAVEVPVFQKQKATLFSAKRIKMSTVTKDTTTYYDWINEIQNVEMKE